MEHEWDDIVVGAGILGLAHAYHLGRRGRRVAVFERDERAVGASVRNFGMLWPIGQPAGSLYRLARRSLEIWGEVLRRAGLWCAASGSLHVAYEEDEAEVLREFVRDAGTGGVSCELLAPPAVLARCPAVQSQGLRAGMWSPTETCVDPREVVGGLPGWLTREFGVEFHFGAAVTAFAPPSVVHAGGRDVRVDRLWVCSGTDFQTLFPEEFRASGMVRCKLQMLRSQPYTGWRLGPMVAAGLTLRHYKGFERCPSLPALKRRVAAEMPRYDRFGIHVMAAQNGRGELILGDSHEYGADVEPFDKPEIDELVLSYLATFLRPPDLRVAARWHGVYARHSTEPFLVLRPAAGATAVTGVGGAGMTLSFGMAEQVVRETLGEQ